MSNSQLDTFKSGIKDNTELALEISSNVIGDSNDENNFPCESLLTNTQVSKLCKAFTNSSLLNVKLLEIQLHKIRQLVEFSGRFLGPLLKTGLPLNQ